MWSQLAFQLVNYWGVREFVVSRTEFGLGVGCKTTAFALLFYSAIIQSRLQDGKFSPLICMLDFNVPLCPCWIFQPKNLQDMN